MATVKFLAGDKENIQSGLTNGTITEGSILITEDTDELAVVDANKDVNFIKSRTQQAYTLNGTSIGALSNGATIPAGTSIDELLNMIVAKAIPASYTKPSVAASVASGKAAGNYEVGTSITTSIKSVFTKNDAGDIVSNTIYKDGTQVATGASSTVNANDQTFVVPAGTVRFNSSASYGDAPVKTNNLGQESKENWFAAGSVSSGNLDFVGKRKAFYGAGNGGVPTLNSQVVRGLAANKMSPAANTVLEIPVAIGQQHVIFAYPATLRDVTQVMYVETNDTGMASSFTKSTVSVGGADATESSVGNYATDYKVYSYAMAAPAAAPMTFKVTI
jgi:hypothetical protein